ncbi:hypothetical protein Tco_0216552 [Tanacetum coccineum]
MFIKKGESPSLNLVMNDYIENPKEVKDKEVDSNVNIFHGFKNVVKVGKGVSHSPSRSRTSKCSTSFGNFKTKDKKGFSFVDEMNRMIKVGGGLGYNVKGCKSSLRKKINRIDEKINAGRTNEEDRDLSVNTLLELDLLEKLESMDLIQKA